MVQVMFLFILFLTDYLSPGNLFHIDFGYILGRDPKPLPPPMKLSKEMVNKTISNKIDIICTTLFHSTQALRFNTQLMAAFYPAINNNIDGRVKCYYYYPLLV